MLFLYKSNFMRFFKIESITPVFLVLSSVLAVFFSPRIMQNSNKAFFLVFSFIDIFIVMFFFRGNELKVFLFLFSDRRCRSRKGKLKITRWKLKTITANFNLRSLWCVLNKQSTLLFTKVIQGQCPVFYGHTPK